MLGINLLLEDKQNTFSYPFHQFSPFLRWAALDPYPWERQLLPFAVVFCFSWAPFFGLPFLVERGVKWSIRHGSWDRKKSKKTNSFYLRAWSVGFMYLPLLVVFIDRRPISLLLQLTGTLIDIKVFMKYYRYFGEYNNYRSNCIKNL